MDTTPWSGIVSRVSSVRAYTYDNIPKSGSVLPKKYKLDNNIISPVLNQKNIMSCIAHGFSAILYANEFHETGNPFVFSPYYIYGKLRKNISGPGMVMSETLQELTKLGSVPIDMFNYPTLEMPEIKNKVLEQPELDIIAEKYKIKGYVRLDKAVLEMSVENIKRALFDNQVPIIIVTKYFGYNHCVVIVGWDDDIGKYDCLNSYGTKQGRNGFFYIPYDEIEEAYLVLDAENSKLPFNDVDKDDWFYDAVKSVYMTGLMNGTSVDTFEPDKKLTRAEMATLMDRLMKKVQSVIEESLKK